MPNNNANTTPIASLKQYNIITPKRKRTINAIKTESYVEHRKRQKQASKSSSTKNKSTSALSESTSTLIPTHSSLDTLTTLPHSTTNSSSNFQKQPSIKSFLSTKASKQAKLPVEAFFKVPNYKNGFNLRSLRCHFNSVTLKRNIVSIMQKSIQNNHINPWNPSNKKHLDTRSSDRIQNRRKNNTKVLTSTKKNSPLLCQQYLVQVVP